MTEDLVYRMVLLLLVAGGLLASAGLAHRVDRQRGKVPRSADGPVMTPLIRLVALAFYGGMLAYLVYPPALGWAAVELPPWLRWIGAGMVATGAALALWARSSLAGSSTLTAVPREDAELVTAGPYRWVRHPVYAAGLLLIPGATLLSANLFIFLSGLAVMIVLLVRTRREEALLVEKFGAAYLAYMERTGRLIPLRISRSPSRFTT